VSPAPLVNLEDVRLAHGTRVLLDGVSLGVAAGDRVGVVGRNGAGKTSLLEVVARRRAPDSGRVSHATGLRVGLLSQTDDLDPRLPVRRVVFGHLPEHAWRSDPRTRGMADALLSGLDLDAAVGALSGGERRRVALAGLLAEDPDLLLLDEPTNHLDVEGVAWLAEHLGRRRAAVVAVTHDRWFLDAVCRRTWEVAGGRVHGYDGGYAAYVLTRAERGRVASAAEERRQALLRKELAWLRRGPPARTSKPRFRIEAVDVLIQGEPPPRDDVELVRVAGARLGRSVLDVEDVSVVLGGRELLAGVTFRLGPGDRFGVVGANGAGKSTLLHLLSGRRQPDAGRVRVGRTVRAGYLPQDTEGTPTRLSALAAAEEVATSIDLGGGRELTARQLAERLGFTGERLSTRVSDLSGGERRRLQLLRLLMAAPNVLLLDEPTNDLDVETMSALEDLLDGWAGTLVVVSHDRYMLERVCDRFVALLGDGSLRDLPGGVQEYLTVRAALDEQILAGAGRSGGPPAPGSARGVDVRAARKEMARIERRLERLSADAARLHALLAQHATDHVVVGPLDAELREVARERAELEELWLAAAESAGADS
jgi:ABC transport system ATP-binding/permease protein